MDGEPAPELSQIDQLIQAINNANENIAAGAARTQALEQQRDGLSEALNRANQLLQLAHDKAAEADQRTREVMGLVGAQWAGIAHPAAADAGIPMGSSKVEIFSDPGSYDGSKAKFEEWWTKAQAWIDCNPKQFMMRDEFGNLVPHAKEQSLRHPLTPQRTKGKLLR
jgi:hypothetical protein